MTTFKFHQIFVAIITVGAPLLLGYHDHAAAQNASLNVNHFEYGGTLQPDGQTVFVDQSSALEPAHLASAHVRAYENGAKIKGFSVSASPELDLRITVLDTQGQILGQVEQHLVASQSVLTFATPVRLDPKQRATILFSKTQEAATGDQSYTFTADQIYVNDDPPIPLAPGAALSYRNAPIRIDSQVNASLWAALPSQCMATMTFTHTYTPGVTLAIDELTVHSSFDADLAELNAQLIRYDASTGFPSVLEVARTTTTDPYVSHFDIASAVQLSSLSAELDGVGDDGFTVCLSVNPGNLMLQNLHAVVEDVAVSQLDASTGTSTQWTLPAPEDLYGRSTQFASYVPLWIPPIILVF